MLTHVLDAEDNDIVADADKMLTTVNADVAVHSSLSSKELLGNLPTTNATAEVLSARISETFADAGAGTHLCLNPDDPAPS